MIDYFIQALNRRYVVVSRHQQWHFEMNFVFASLRSASWCTYPALDLGIEFRKVMHSFVHSFIHACIHSFIHRTDVLVMTSYPVAQNASALPTLSG